MTLESSMEPQTEVGLAPAAADDLASDAKDSLRMKAEAPPSSRGFSTSDETFRVPSVFGRFLLLKLVARGGMGDVYLGATTGIEGAERPIIVKTVRRDHIHDGSFLARFLDEARVQSQLHHPGVAQVLEASTDDSGEPYVVVEFVEGRSLADVRQRAVQLGARINWPEAVALAIEVAQALAHVHERAGIDGTPLGIVHRDLSPQNVMVGYAGETKLIDFGTARGQNRRCHTVAGVVFAKPGYVAPEVARQQVGDGRIDVYALGIMLWELCAGRRFLTGDAQKHLEDAAGDRIVVPAIAEDIGAPPLLDQVIARLTANDPDARYSSAALAAIDLARILMEAPSKPGERGVRGRIANLMKTLWTHEPMRSRNDFAKLLREARPLVKERFTPNKTEVAAKAAEGMNEEAILSGTPYRLLSKIGEGESGEVYEAEHVELGRRLAIKILAPEHGSAKDAVDRFRREARAIATLSHPNLCTLYDFGRSLDGRVFLAMELLKGQSIDRYLREARGMDWREAVAIAIEATKALEAAHGAGVVHRDLKPANLFLLRKGGLKLVDFGVALALSDVATQGEEQRQKGFAIFGTPEYMAPEQVAGEAVDGRCDLYALGCVLYELVTGHPPFDGPSNVVIMGKHLRELPEPPRIRAPLRAIPDSVESVVMTALSKKPENRFATATAMREALEATLAPPPPSPRPRRVRIAAAVMVTASMVFAGYIGMKAAPTVAMRMLPPGTIRPASADNLSLPESNTKLTAADLAVVDPGQNVEAPETDSKDAPRFAAAPASPAVKEAVAAGTPGTAAIEDFGNDDAADDKKVALADRVDKSEDRSNPSAASERPELKRLNDARAVAKAKPSDPAALKKWALAAYSFGDYREARRATDAWSLKDRSPEPRMFLARVLDTMGRRFEARSVLQELLEQHPDLGDARKMVSRLGTPMGTPDAPTTHPRVARK